MAEIKSREDQVCESVRRFIEKKEEISLIKETKPDLIERNKQAVDSVYSVRLEDKKFVVEHTLLESFPTQIYDGLLFTELALTLQDDMKEQLPKPGTYRLIIPINVLKNVNIKIVCRNLKNWIQASASNLEMSKVAETTSVLISGFPLSKQFKVRLTRIDLSDDGSLTCWREYPPEAENLRKQQLEITLNKKCPKLKAAKSEFGNSESILILELNDSICANPSLIAESIRILKEKREGDIPDRIYLVDTSTPCWWIGQYDYTKNYFSKMAQLN